MNNKLVLACLVAVLSAPAAAESESMSFFLTSAGPGKGGDLGGLKGADQHCQTLAESAGAGHRSWRAYLSTQASGFKDQSAVAARDRIGTGPWFNARGVMIANDVDELHFDSNNLTRETALDEKGRLVNGRTDKPNQHDIMTGSRPDGSNFPPSPPFPDMTCGNWTKGGSEGSAMLGHHDRVGPNGDSWATSWLSAHPSLGCDPASLNKTGGNGYFYCFTYGGPRKRAAPAAYRDRQFDSGPNERLAGQYRPISVSTL
jgi:hypothetical protein